MACLIVVETYQALLGAILTHVALLATRVTSCRPSRPTRPAMESPTLGTPAPDLLALTRRIRGLRLHSLTPRHLCLIILPLRAGIQLDFPLVGLLHHLV